MGSWCKNVAKKALALGVPYATFTTVTCVLKKVFSSSVNDQIGGLGDTLFLHPTAPYWYLYVLFFIFLVTPTFSSVKAAAVGLIVALGAKALILTGRGDSVYDVSTVLSNEIWFVLGMSICAFSVQLKGRKVQGTICGLLFIILSILVYTAEISGSVISFAMGLLACIAVVLMVADLEEEFGRGMEILTRDVPDFCVAVESPARVIKNIEKTK